MPALGRRRAAPRQRSRRLDEGDREQLVRTLLPRLEALAPRPDDRSYWRDPSAWLDRYRVRRAATIAGALAGVPDADRQQIVETVERRERLRSASPEILQRQVARRRWGELVPEIEYVLAVLDVDPSLWNAFLTRITKRLGLQPNLDAANERAIEEHRRALSATDREGALAQLAAKRAVRVRPDDTRRAIDEMRAAGERVVDAAAALGVADNYRRRAVPKHPKTVR